MTDFSDFGGELHLDGKVMLFNGDSRDVLKGLPDASVDSVVTDPPYALVSIVKRFGAEGAAPTKDGDVYSRASAGFMGKQWDTGETAFAVEFWAEVMRVLKPGGFVIAASGTRTYHRLAVAIEDAGFEIRDMISWLYGSGFPKSHDVSKGIDKAAGVERAVIGRGMSGSNSLMGGLSGVSGEVGHDITAPSTPEAAQWQGWGTALKPACEPWVLARKPLRSLDLNVLEGIESRLRERGVVGEIVWKCGAASGAGSAKAPAISSSTGARQTEETFAATADGSATASAVQQTRKPSGPLMPSGVPETASTCDATPAPAMSNCATKSSPPTAESASVVGNAKSASSPSTTSTEAERPTESKCTVKSITNSAEKDSLTDTGCFAGIATGLTGSMARVLIRQNEDGTFEWPEGLPDRVPGKPLTVAANVLAHGVGALNIDGCRVPADDLHEMPASFGKNEVYGKLDYTEGQVWTPSDNGRFPANVIHNGSDEVANGGLPLRYFYSAKADSLDRVGSKHPTVKPVDLMQYLCRLITPPGGIVLDPFAGSGSTGEAAWREGFRCVLIEREAEYADDIRERMKLAPRSNAMKRKIIATKKAGDLPEDGLFSL